MIRVSVATCDGQKPAPIVTDDLIATEAMARKRGEQELADMIMILKGRTLRMPLQLYEIGTFVPFSYSKLQIDGVHKVANWRLATDFRKTYVTMKITQPESLCG